LISFLKSKSLVINCFTAHCSVEQLNSIQDNALQCYVQPDWGFDFMYVQSYCYNVNYGISV